MSVSAALAPSSAARGAIAATWSCWLLMAIAAVGCYAGIEWLAALCGVVGFGVAALAH